MTAKDVKGSDRLIKVVCSGSGQRLLTIPSVLARDIRASYMRVELTTDGRLIYTPVREVMDE